VHVHDNAFFASLPLGCVGRRGKPWSQWKLLPRDTEYWPPPPFVPMPRFLLRRYWKNVVFINPLDTPGGLGLEPDQDARWQLVPNLRRLLPCPSGGIRGPDPGSGVVKNWIGARCERNTETKDNAKNVINESKPASAFTAGR